MGRKSFRLLNPSRMISLTGVPASDLLSRFLTLLSTSTGTAVSPVDCRSTGPLREAGVLGGGLLDERRLPEDTGAGAAAGVTAAEAAGTAAAAAAAIEAARVDILGVLL